MSIEKNIGVFATVLLLGGAAALRHAPTARTALPHESPAAAGRLVLRADHNGRCHAEAYINGVRVNVLLDSGADRIFITSRQARRFGFDPARLGYDHTYSQWGGTVRGASVVVREFRLGGFVANNVDASIDTTDYGEPLIGAPVLNLLHFQVTEGFCVVSW